MKLEEANFRCILVKSNACKADVQYHLLVIFNHSQGCLDRLGHPDRQWSILNGASVNPLSKCR